MFWLKNRKTFKHLLKKAKEIPDPIHHADDCMFHIRMFKSAAEYGKNSIIEYDKSCDLVDLVLTLEHYASTQNTQKATEIIQKIKDCPT